MGRGLAVLFASALVCAGSSSAQTPTPAQAPAPDGIEVLLDRVEALLQTGRAADFPSLVSTNFPAEDVEAFASGLFFPGIRRALVVERDRVPLTGAQIGRASCRERV